MANKDGLRIVSVDKIWSRRQMISGSAISVSGLLVLFGQARAGGAERDKDKAGSSERNGNRSGGIDTSTSIHQEIDFKAAPERVYEALLDSKKFSAFTGMAAEIHREPGGAFLCFEGQIVGRIVELVPNQRIVQAWRSNGWPAGVYSIVKFELNKQDSATRLVMDHRGFPDGAREHLDAGWKSHYWEPLAKYLG
jgi:activator of HSP90 ATPase